MYFICTHWKKKEGTWTSYTSHVLHTGGVKACTLCIRSTRESADCVFTMPLPFIFLSSTQKRASVHKAK